MMDDRYAHTNRPYAPHKPSPPVDPRVADVRKRRENGEGSVWAWSCGDCCGYIMQKISRCPECGDRMYGERGYWWPNQADDSEESWFFPITYIRDGIPLEVV